MKAATVGKMQVRVAPPWYNMYINEKARVLAIGHTKLWMSSGTAT